MNRFVFALLSILLVLGQLQAQTLQELQKRKQKTLDEINYTSRLLNETDKNARITLNKLEVLNQQIGLRGRLLNDFDEQLKILQQSIDDNQFVVDCLKEDLEKIRTSYANLIRQAYRNRSTYNQLVFLLSSADFNQAYKRMLYTRQVARYRERQLELIEVIRDIQQKKIEDLSKRRSEHLELLNRQKLEFSQLRNEKEKQFDYHKQLQKKERELKDLLRQQKQVEERLQREIDRVIDEEARRTAQKGATPQEKQLSGNFEKNKGKFPWPVSQGVITDKFGEHPHPVMKSVIIHNRGIDITTHPGEKARAIFNGTVSRVLAIPGANMAVIVRHGQYLTIYSNLKEVFVKQDDPVKTQQEIGLIYSDPGEDNKTVLKFQIRKERITMNPEEWITN